MTAKPRSVAVNHAGLWSQRRQFESARGYFILNILCSDKNLFLVDGHLLGMAVDCVIILDYPSEKEAEAVLAAISPDNAPYAEAARSGRKLTIHAGAAATGQMLHTLDDLLACVKIAEEAVQASR